MEKNLLKDMGKRLSARRKQLGLTQEQLAEKMDVSIQMISNLELGKKAIRPENLLKICQILDISSDYVLTGNKSEKETTKMINSINQLSNKEIEIIEMIIAYFIDNKS
ncbi:MAG: helix-turn-helix domain-containing protein [Eubacterium sp.]